MLFFLFNTFCGVCCKKHANLLVPFEMVGLACCFLYVVHLGFLLLDSLVVDVLIVRHELVDGARWGQLMMRLATVLMNSWSWLANSTFPLKPIRLLLKA